MCVCVCVRVCVRVCVCEGILSIYVELIVGVDLIGS